MHPTKSTFKARLSVLSIFRLGQRRSRTYRLLVPGTYDIIAAAVVVPGIISQRLVEQSRGVVVTTNLRAVCTLYVHEVYTRYLEVLYVYTHPGWAAACMQSV